VKISRIFELSEIFLIQKYAVNKGSYELSPTPPPFPFDIGFHLQFVKEKRRRTEEDVKRGEGVNGVIYIQMLHDVLCEQLLM
jgi:hypothetical protein